MVRYPPDLLSAIAPAAGPETRTVSWLGDGVDGPSAVDMMLPSVVPIRWMLSTAGDDAGRRSVPVHAHHPPYRGSYPGRRAPLTSVCLAPVVVVGGGGPGQLLTTNLALDLLQ